MTLARFRPLRCRQLRAALLVACAAGCAAARPDYSAFAEQPGTVAAALSTVGPDGASYSLPPGTTITFALSGGDSTTEPLAAGSPTQSFSLPPGTYAVTLSQSGREAGADWALTRAGDGGPTTVLAVLTDALPISVVVTAGQTTPLTFHFATEMLGNVAFGTGGVDAGVALDAGAFPLSTGTVTGTAMMSVDAVDGSATFNNALHFGGTVSVSYTLSLTRSGGWVIASDQVCAPVSATTSASSKNAALAAIVSEVSGGTGTICFGDPNLTGAFSVHLARTGAPTTSTMKTDLPSGGTFELALTGLAPEVFDGTTLRLGSLPEPFAPVDVTVSEVVSSGASVLADVSSAPSGTASVTLRR